MVLREVRWEMPVGVRPVFPQWSMGGPSGQVQPYRTDLGIVLGLCLAPALPCLVVGLHETSVLI